MGTFGTGLYDDDHAMDIKSLYKDLRRAKIIGPNATAVLLENSFEGNKSNFTGDPVFWLVLADLQWKDGVLDSLVSKNVRQVVSAAEGLDLWEDETQRKARERLYQKILKQIDAKMPPPKIKGEPYYDSCTWKVGEVVAYQIGKSHSSLANKFVLLEVMYHYTQLGGSSPVFELKNWLGSSKPTELPANLSILNTFQLSDVDPHTNQEYRQRLSKALDWAKVENKIPQSITLDDLIRDKMSTRIPVISFTGKESELRRLLSVGHSKNIIPREKLLTSMVPYSWKDFDAGVARLYNEYWKAN